MKKIKTAEFVGRQLSRLKAGQALYSIIIQAVMALGIVKIAFPDISAWTLLLCLPVMVLGALLIGYLMDIWSVISLDHRKTIEMSNRYLHIADLKVIDFQIVQMKCFFEWFKAIKENKPLDFKIFEKEYKKYLKRYSPPEKK